MGDAAEGRLELEHDFLDSAKEFAWGAVRTMLEDTPDLINVQPSGRWTALHQAAFQGNGDVCKELLERGANHKAVNRGGQTPLDVAKGGAKEALMAHRGPLAAAAEDGALAPSPAKKARKAKPDPVYTLNINNAVDKEYEHCSLQDIAAAPTSALQGVAKKGQDVLKKFGVKTISDLGGWKFYRIAKAIAGLAELEIEGARPEGAALNINKALIKKHETKSMKELLALPPSALEGLAPWGDAELATLHIKTVAQLGDWKFARWAEHICDLAEFESADFSS